MESSLDEFTTIPKVEEYFSDDETDRILGYIISIGASYPMEISRHLLINFNSVNVILIHLTNQGKLKRIVPDELYPQPLIKTRIPDMWSKGISGYGEFARRSWFIATEEGFYYYADKFRGQHRQMSYAYISTYDLPIIDSD